MSETSFSSTGKFFYTAKSTGTFDITAYGAQGGGSNYAAGGKGAEIGGSFSLATGEKLEIIVGGQGGSYSDNIGLESGAGGGGGSFVFEDVGGVLTKLVIAGGGGGAGVNDSKSYGGSTGASGINGETFPLPPFFTFAGGKGGTGGHGGGGGAEFGGGGGGYSGGNSGVNFNGTDYTTNNGYAGGGSGTGFAGGSGVYKSKPFQANAGGYGGGGGGDAGGGGGGGYGGGGGGANAFSGGGGGSFDGGTGPQTLISSEHSGGGLVLIAQEPVCYLRGTHILTPAGEVFVEALRIGDRVVTRFNGIRTIKWLGRQSYDARFVRNNPANQPVCIRAGALDDRLPIRDLYVSPGHSLLIGNILVLARDLVNGVTITQDWAPEAVHYYQIELDSHDCVIAEGIWAETYADAPGLRAAFHNAADYHALYPDTPPAQELHLCASRPERGQKFQAALRPSAAHAARAVQPGRLEGWIERATDWKIEGWAFDHAHPQLPVLLEIVSQTEVIGEILACDYRGDLAEAQKGNGRCSFSYASPIRLPAETLSSLRIRRASDGADIFRIGAGNPAFHPNAGLRLVG